MKHPWQALAGLLGFLTATAFAQPVKTTVKRVEIHAIGGLRYDKVRFSVRPGDELLIIVRNKDDMDHNLLITVPGAREEIVDAALKLGDKGPGMDYIPHSPKVLQATSLLAPNETDSIRFTAPEKEGVYPYVCTYPGHGLVMYGAMYVTSGDLPPLENDPHIPEEKKSASARKMHPYDPVPPYLYRIFMPDAGPAAIAVSLPHDISYCWDAGVCRLRYAWHGGFVDNSKAWSIKGDATAKIIGKVFFRERAEFPIRIGNRSGKPEVEYKGYRLLEGYPEFHYTIDGVDIYELLKPLGNGTGLIRYFRIPQAEQPVWVTSHPQPGIEISASGRNRPGRPVKLSPAEARQFSITITMNKE